MLKYQEENYTKKEMIKIKILIFSNIIQNKNIKKLIKNINNKNYNWLKFFMNCLIHYLIFLIVIIIF